MSRTLLSLAGFQVITIGRFWVIAEGAASAKTDISTFLMLSASAQCSEIATDRSRSTLSDLMLTYWGKSGTRKRRCTIICVKKPVSFRRRRLSSVVRKAITSYYTEQEQKEIETVARLQNVSKSSFVASAALKEARRFNH